MQAQSTGTLVGITMTFERLMIRPPTSTMFTIGFDDSFFRVHALSSLYQTRSGDFGTLELPSHHHSRPQK